MRRLGWPVTLCMGGSMLKVDQEGLVNMGPPWWNGNKCIGGKFGPIACNQTSSVSTFLECGRVWTSSYLQLPNVNKPIQLATATSLLQPNEYPAMIGPAITRI